MVIEKVFVPEDHPSAGAGQQERTTASRKKQTTAHRANLSGKSLFTPPKQRRVQATQLVPVESSGLPTFSRGRSREANQRSFLGSRDKLKDDRGLGPVDKHPNAAGISGQRSKLGYKLFNLKNHAVPLKSEKDIFLNGRHRKDSIANRVLAYAQVLPTIVTSDSQDDVNGKALTSTDERMVSGRTAKSTLKVNVSMTSNRDNEGRLQSPRSVHGTVSHTSSRNSTNDPDSHERSRRLSGSRSPTSVSSHYGFNVPSGYKAMKRFKRVVKRKTFGIKLRMIARIYIVLQRLWKHHSNRVTETLDWFDLSTNIFPENEVKEVLFDKTIYKAQTEAQISSEARRILTKEPPARTEEELLYLRNMLVNYPAIAEYPIKLQKKLAKVAWLDRFGANRVIVREGHYPLQFYFILSGKVVLTAFDEDRQACKTLCFLNRGESFGDLAILNRAPRECNVISCGKVELLCLSEEDFLTIFMNGGLNDPNDPFLKSLYYLRGWPLNLIAENPKKAIFTFFKRNTVLVNNSNDNEWLYIVKSGSCSVMKKLHVEDRDITQKPMLKRKRPKPFTKQLLSHSELIQNKLSAEIRRLEAKWRLRHVAISQLNVPVSDIATEIIQKAKKHSEEKKKVLEEAVNRLVEKTKTKLVLDEDTDRRSVLTKERTTDSITMKREKSNITLSTTKPVMTPISPLKSTSECLELDLDKSDTRNTGTVKHTLNELLPNDGGTSGNGGGQGESVTRVKQKEGTEKESKRKSAFVEINVLTKGNVFGLTDLFFKKQASLILVSNGAEVIMLHKKFYMENVNFPLMASLNQKLYPYPSDEQLQRQLYQSLQWSEQRKSVVGEVIEAKRRRKINIHNSRDLI